MPAELDFHPAARAELAEAVEEYEHQREGRGVRFNLAFNRALDFIADAPHRWPAARRVPAHLGARAFMLKRFPYDIIYRHKGDNVLVIAVAHHKRKPGYWADRTTG